MFTLNGKTYKTDAETKSLLTGMVASYHAGAEGVRVAIQAVMALGMKAGRIVEVL